MDYFNMKSLAVIPARYASTRFPGKPLAKIMDREMVIWVCESVNRSGLFGKVIVATDDSRIQNIVTHHGFNAMMTSENHINGTQRCEEVLRREEMTGEKYDIVVNVQGDEPMICREQLESLLNIFGEYPQSQIATLMKRIDNKAVLLSPNVVKVVAGGANALYFSRSVIPYSRENTSIDDCISKGYYHKHIGLYAFRAEVLHQIVSLKPSFLEGIEALEQLRWLENGYKIGITTTEYESFGIDTPEDLQSLNIKLSKE
jgi:3-deoxy-manno-octulosonate cytidylyltransferase (CMP-KDO synthetase)